MRFLANWTRLEVTLILFNNKTESNTPKGEIFMKPAIRIMDRFDAEKYSMGNHSCSSVIISIVSKGSPKNNLPITQQNGIKDVLRLSFDDVDHGENSIDEKSAASIAQFVENWKDKIDLIIVHCEAGISRSAGVGAAIMKYLYNDDSLIFNSPRYAPNMLCYRRVLNALYNKN